MNTSNNIKSIVFVADFFSEDLVGGAELTTEALIEESPYRVIKIRSSELSQDLIMKNVDSYWIFGNWSNCDPRLLQIVTGNLSYSILEYDYKICKYRSPEKHLITEGVSCNCHKTQLGQFVSLFYGGAKSLFWMSEQQMHFYLSNLPHLKRNKNVVLSSVFSKSFFHNIEKLNQKNSTRNGWVVLESNSWIKGYEDAESWCYANDKDIKKVSNLTPEQLLQVLSESEGLVYLPRGGDTCPRLVIEAKLLGCKLELNNFVQHKDEIWFNSPDEEILSYLKNRPYEFWEHIKNSANKKIEISGYTTTRNCIEQKYPYEDCIKSMLSFCDEVVVVDGGSTDGTWEKLKELADKNKKLKIHQIIRDWNHKRFAVFDGLQKADARKLCTKEFCWQMDADEVLPPWDWEKVKKICEKMNSSTELISLPVVEYWGSKDKVRIDINPWKWRLSRNDKNITHGIPVNLRLYDENGDLYSRQGTDGCDYIYEDTGEYVPHVSFYDQNAHQARLAAMSGNQEAFIAFENWFKRVVENLPSVRHFSWIDIKRKIRTYKNFWQKHWESLYGLKQEDTAENNKFFDKPWSQVTEDEIDRLAEKMAKELGGHIFHSKIDWSRPTPWIKID
jgi:glycosyltransferase involved in cell wall biosynthesis